MDEKIIVAIIAAVSAIAGGLISSVIGPVIKHRLEQSTSEKGRRREQIQKWRNMILQIGRESNGNTVSSALQSHPDFLTLEPHLTQDGRGTVKIMSHAIMMGSSMSQQLGIITSEISRIERKWGLR